MHGGIFFVPASILAPGAGDPARCLEEPFAVWIVTRPADERADSVLHVARDFRNLFGVDEVAVFGFAMLERWIYACSSPSDILSEIAACSRMSGISNDLPIASLC